MLEIVRTLYTSTGDLLCINIELLIDVIKNSTFSSEIAILFFLIRQDGCQLVHFARRAEQKYLV